MDETRVTGARLPQCHDLRVHPGLPGEDGPLQLVVTSGVLAVDTGWVGHKAEGYGQVAVPRDWKARFE